MRGLISDSRSLMKPVYKKCCHPERPFCKAVNVRSRFALTGTPIENRLGELWSIFDFLMPGFLFGNQYFRREYEIPITKERNEQALERLKADRTFYPAKGKEGCIKRASG